MNKHYHVWSTSISGQEYANATYDNHIDACVDFLGISQHLMKNSPGEKELNIETVVNSIEHGGGMFVGGPALVLMISKCGGDCLSPTWN